MKFKKIFKNIFIRDISVLLSGTVIAQIIAFAVYPILSRIYTTDEMGTYALFMSIVAITAIISTGRYELAFLLPKNQADAKALLAFTWALALTTSVLLVIVVALFSDFIALQFEVPELKFWLWLIPVSTLLSGLFQTFEYWYTRQKLYKNISIGHIVQSITGSGGKIASYNIFSQGGGLILGFILGQLSAAVYFISKIRNTGFSGFKQLSIHKMLAQAAKYYKFPAYRASLNLINNLSSSLPVFVIGYYYTLSAVGLFSIAVTIVFKPTNMIANSVRQVLYQRASSRYNSGFSITRNITETARNSGLLMLIPFVLVIIAGPWLFDFIFGDEWREAGIYMQLMLPWLYSAFLMNLVSFIPDMFGYQKKALWIDIVKLIVRTVALFVGGLSGNIYITIGLFSLVSLFVNVYLLVWYRQILNLSDLNS